MDGLLFTQLYVVPATEPVNTMAVTADCWHKTWSAGCATVAVGFTVIVKVLEPPGQPLPAGVTVMVAVTGEAVKLIALKAGILPVPLAARPMDGSVLVQFYMVPPEVTVKTTASVNVLLQSSWFEG